MIKKYYVKFIGVGQSIAKDGSQLTFTLGG